MVALDDDARLSSVGAANGRAHRCYVVLTGESKPRLGTILSWSLLITVLVGVSAHLALRDFRESRVSGDQASYLLQVVSLSDPDGMNLSYDRRDLGRWFDLDWGYPQGLFFQEYSDGYAFAKPYGYSLYAAGFVRVLGVTVGIGLANAMLVVALTCVSVAILRFRFRGPTVPLLALAFCFASYAYMYAYIIHEDLFLAVLTGVTMLAALWWWRSQQPWLAALTFALMAFAVSDKMVLLALFLPIAVGMLVRERRRLLRVALPVLGVVVFAVSVVPYLHYSDGRSWHPYGGIRYISNGLVPFDGGYAEGLEFRGWRRQRTDETVSVRYAVENIVNEPDQILQSGFYYVFGRHTGMFVFIPVALFLLAAALARIRRLDALGWLILVGIGLYIATYLVMFTDDYYGTAPFGNRYFLQIAPSVLALAVAAGIRERVALIAAVGGIALGLLFLWPHHVLPDDPLPDLRTTSAPQRLFPVEVNQRFVPYLIRDRESMQSRPSNSRGSVSQSLSSPSDPAASSSALGEWEPFRSSPMRGLLSETNEVHPPTTVKGSPHGE